MRLRHPIGASQSVGTDHRLPRPIAYDRLRRRITAGDETHGNTLQPPRTYIHKPSPRRPLPRTARTAVDNGAPRQRRTYQSDDARRRDRQDEGNHKLFLSRCPLRYRIRGRGIGENAACRRSCRHRGVISSLSPCAMRRLHNQRETETPTPSRRHGEIFRRSCSRPACHKTGCRLGSPRRSRDSQRTAHHPC